MAVCAYVFFPNVLANFVSVFDQRGLGSSQESIQTELITQSPPVGCRKETFLV